MKNQKLSWSDGLYKNVVRLCKKNGIPIYKLEKELGFGNGTIRAWKVCAPKLDFIKAVADYFGTGIDALMEESD